MADQEEKTMKLSEEQVQVLLDSVPDEAKEVVEDKIAPLLCYPHIKKDNIRVVVTPAEGDFAKPVLAYDCSMSIDLTRGQGTVYECLDSMLRSASIGIPNTPEGDDEKAVIEEIIAAMKAAVFVQSGGAVGPRGLSISITLKFRRFSITITFQW